MKRHPALVPLSREHHRCLVVAQLLKKDAADHAKLPSDPEGKKQYALEFFDHCLTAHMKAEEDILFKAVRGINAEIDALIDKLIEEHKELVKRMNELEIAEDLVEAMDQLGHLLAEHVRDEERKLFEKLQKACPEEELALLHFPHTEKG